LRPLGILAHVGVEEFSVVEHAEKLPVREVPKLRIKFLA